MWGGPGFDETEKSMGNDLQRLAAAYHEAGHAAMAYEVGWWVNHEGVEIDRRQYTGLQLKSINYTLRNRAMVNCAGWASEHLRHGRGNQSRDDEHLSYVIYEVRGGDPEEIEFLGDDADTFVALLEALPEASDDDLIVEFRRYEEAAREILSDPEIWTCVTRIATALVEKGALNQNEIEGLLYPSNQDAL